MSVLSKNLYPLDMEFEETGNDNVDKALLQFSKLSLEDMDNMIMGMMDLTNIFSGDCEELKDITKQQIEDKTYTPNLLKSNVINILTEISDY